jgi:hypothetical protein
VSFPLLTCPLRRYHPVFCTAEVGNPGGTYELLSTCSIISKSDGGRMLSAPTNLAIKYMYFVEGIRRISVFSGKIAIISVNNNNIFRTIPRLKFERLDFQRSGNVFLSVEMLFLSIGLLL